MAKNNTTTPAVSVIDLSVTMPGDVTIANLADYTAAVRDSFAKDATVTYGRTVVYMAARDLSDVFTAAAYAKEIGKSEAYVSTFAGLALAIDRGITPHGTQIMRRRWTALVQNMSKDVRRILRDKKSNLTKDLDPVLFAAADAKSAKKSDDAKAARAKAAADKKSTDSVTTEVTMTVESALTSLDQAVSFLALSEASLTPANRETISDLFERLGNLVTVDA